NGVAWMARISVEGVQDEPEAERLGSRAGDEPPGKGNRQPRRGSDLRVAPLLSFLQQRIFSPEPLIRRTLPTVTLTGCRRLAGIEQSGLVTARRQAPWHRRPYRWRCFAARSKHNSSYRRGPGSTTLLEMTRHVRRLSTSRRLWRPIQHHHSRGPLQAGRERRRAGAR